MAKPQNIGGKVGLWMGVWSGRNPKKVWSSPGN